MIRFSRTIGLAAICALAVGRSPTTRSAPPRQPEDPARLMKPYVGTIAGTPVTFEMLPIPGGTFTLGSPMIEEKRGEDEGPRHAVRIAPFWMGKCEVTWDEFDQFAHALDLKKKARENVDLSTQPETEKQADAVTRPTGPYMDETFGFGRDGQPVLGPIVLPDAEEYSYVVRGGSWDDDADKLRSAARHGSNLEWSIQDPDRPQSIWWHTDATFVGFRIVRPLVEQENLRGLKSQVVKGKRIR